MLPAKSFAKSQEGKGKSGVKEDTTEPPKSHGKLNVDSTITSTDVKVKKDVGIINSVKHETSSIIENDSPISEDRNAVVLVKESSHGKHITKPKDIHLKCKISSMRLYRRPHKRDVDELLQYALSRYKIENGDQSPPNWDRMSVKLMKTIKEKYLIYDGYDYEFYRDILKKIM